MEAKDWPHPYFSVVPCRVFPKACQSFWQPVGSSRKPAGNPGKERYRTGFFTEIETFNAIFGDFTFILLELLPFYRKASQEFWQPVRSSGFLRRISGKLSGTPDCLPGFRGRKPYRIGAGLGIEAVNALLGDFALIIIRIIAFVPESFARFPGACPGFRIPSQGFGEGIRMMRKASRDFQQAIRIMRKACPDLWQHFRIKSLYKLEK
jgi:hypothetical protein